jgi:hypothetical protein
VKMCSVVSNQGCISDIYKSATTAIFQELYFTVVGPGVSAGAVGFKGSAEYDSTGKARVVKVKCQSSDNRGYQLIRIHSTWAGGILNPAGY